MAGADNANTDREPPRGWVLIAAPILGAGLSVAVTALALTGAMLFLHQTPTQKTMRAFMHGLATNYFFALGLTILIYLAMLFAIWLLLPKRGPGSLGSYFRMINFPTALLASLSGLGFAVGVMTVLGFLMASHLVTFHATRAEQMLIPHGWPQLGIALLGVAVVGPLVEEIYFRGLLLRWLAKRMPVAPAALPNAALFAAIHFRFSTHIGIEGWVLTGGLFAFGLFAVAWAASTRSVWPSFIAHGMYNGILVALPLLAMK